MKRFILLFLTLLFVSCKKEGTPVPSENAKEDFRIEFLFECDGIKMYRFYDCGEVRYFTTGNGKMTYSINMRRSGKRLIEYDGTVIQ